MTFWDVEHRIHQLMHDIEKEKCEGKKLTIDINIIKVEKKGETVYFGKTFHSVAKAKKYLDNLDKEKKMLESFLGDQHKR